MSMRRHMDRDLSPRMKRPRAHSPDIDSYGAYDRMNYVDYDRYGRPDHRRSPTPPPIMKERYYTPGEMYEQRYDQRNRDTGREGYRSLCVSNIHPKAQDKMVEEYLKNEYKQFGDFNVKFSTFNGERVAYMNFRYPDHAREARHGGVKLVLYERMLRVQPVLGGSNKRYHNSPPPPERVIPEEFRGRRADSPPRSRDDQEAAQRRDVKFPHHLNHLDPEDDQMATRTLFVGNLHYDITDEEIREFFEKYGFIEDVDIKRPQKGVGNAYAFIRYMNLDMAHRAKVDMSGQYIRSFQCKIGYGKVTPTPCLWVGGLGPWIQYDSLEEAFVRFGPVQRIEWPQGKNYAYILYNSVDCAVQACNNMRGYPLGGSDKRIRVDYGEAEHINNDPGVRRKVPVETRPGTQRTDGSRERVTKDIVPSGRRLSTAEDSGVSATMETATTVSDLARCLPAIWNGVFLLKNSNFGARMHMLRGEERLVDHFMNRRASSDLTQLNITQRMRLDPIKLDDVSQRIQAAGDSGFCVLLAVAATVAVEGSQQPQRPLRNLVSYLRTKESAGVVFLTGSGSMTGVLHAFPPCDFAHNLLVQRALRLPKEIGTKDDHLVILLIRSSAA